MKKIKNFFIIGLISTIIDYGIYSSLVYFSINYNLAIILGYSGGFFVNFFLVRKYVFNLKKIKKIYLEFIAILIISIVGLILNILLVHLLYEYFKINLYISRVIAIIIVFFYNFFTRKGVVYG